MKLSAVIITYNEERNIERCLLSIMNIVDEILVVDSFSTDNTVDICNRYNVKVLQHAFEGYGMQKRYATEQAKYDYVLALDADEELSEELKKSVLRMKESGVNAPYYSFNRLNIYCGKPIKHGGWYPDRQIRIFNRRETTWSVRNVHESVECISGVKPEHLTGDLNHYTTYSIEEHKAKERKYAAINAKALVEKKKPISFLTPYVKGGFRFLKTYVLKLGFLDGYYGWVIAGTLAKSSYLKYKLARIELK